MPKRPPARLVAPPRGRPATASRARTSEADIAEAGDPCTPTTRLIELARSMSPRLLRALAANPSTPRGILESLLRHFPAEVAANPAWPLMSLVDPLFGEQIQQVQAATSNDASMLEQLAEQPALQQQVARNPTTSPSLLAALAARGDRGVRVAVAQHPRCAPSTLEALADDEDLEVRFSVAYHPGCPVATLRVLAAHGVAYIDNAIALHEQAPPDLLDRLSQSESATVRRAVASNRFTPAETLTRLSLGADDHMLSTLASNPATPAPVLEAIARQGNPPRQRQVACHAGAAPATLAWLATQPDVWVRQKVAAHTSAPAGALDALASDASPSVREIVARHPSLPLGALRRLLTDKQRTVRHAAIRHRALPADELARLASGKGPDAFVARLAQRERRQGEGAHSVRSLDLRRGAAAGALGLGCCRPEGPPGAAASVWGSRASALSSARERATSSRRVFCQSSFFRRSLATLP